MNGDEFARLVASANPATRQYQPANTGYPPAYQPSSPQPLDPFFDDEDDMPDTAFGRPIAMQSTESGLPLHDAAANPAGHSKITLPGTGQPQGWNFDDDIPVEQPKGAFDGSASFPGPSSMSKTLKPKPKKKWKWPWAKDEELRGERVVALNDFSGQSNAEFKSNYVSTSKYNLVTFVPKFLAGGYTIHFELRRLGLESHST